ncbi:50S ribosomal protein L21 [Candidatus Bandiella euplotis]|uniref:Large ribosomal subunit protein bL21 n=1 Tax=Candidatus Bandiella euplotis TaxID=1664265 RepID=A0ABZ0ULE1_9RICK|nr:50S ribosomal protein L21 [Candidatus Bandiella woodruffii]WPX96954.1 50S ribosomal protein L21 [Candidatus Bandiella woodruffii]
MLAIIETGGKQYHVKTGDIIKAEKLEAKHGDMVSFDKVLALYHAEGGASVVLGEPYVKSAVVKAEVLEQMKDKKVIVFKKKRRHNYRRKNGHRQNLTVLRITAIEDK